MAGRPVERHNAVLRAAQGRAAAMEAKLAALIEPILNGAGDDAANAFLRVVQPVRLASDENITAAAQADVRPLSTMIAVRPTPEQAAVLAETSDHPADDLHVTLAYLGEYDGDLADLADVLRATSVSHAPLEGQVAGVGVFADNGKGHPSILLPSVPGLVELRVEVTEALVDAGYDFGRQYGYQPHMTHGYLPDPNVPPVELLGLPLSFNDICIVRGGEEEVRLPLVGGKPVTASADNAGWITRYDLSGVRYETFAEQPQHPGWTKPSADELLDAHALADEIRARTTPLMHEVVRTVMEATFQQAGSLTSAADKKPPDPNLSWDVTNPFTAKVLAQTGSQVTSITKTTQANVMSAVDRAYKDGLSIPQTADAIRQGMKDASPARATLIARTELAGAVNGGSLAATQIVSDATGLNLLKQWLTAPGAQFPRHELVDGLNGQTTTLEGYFDVSGAELSFPGDPAGPPEEVCACRCTIAYTEAGETIATGDAEEQLDPESAADEAAAAAEDAGGGGDTAAGTGDSVPDLPAFPTGAGTAEATVLTDVNTAADAFIEGITQTEKLRGKTADPAELDAARKKFQTAIRASISDDAGAVARVSTAAEYNQGSDLFNASTAKYGADRVLVIKDGEVADLLRPGGDLTMANRRTGNRVTVIRENATRKERAGAIQAGDATTADHGGLAAVLRHEYGHQIEEELTADQRETFRALLPDQEMVRAELSKYGATGLNVGNSQEAFSELFSVVTDPAYRAEDWAPWVNDFRNYLDDWTAVKRPIIEPPPVVEPPPPVAPPVERPYAHVKDVTLDTQLYRTKKLMTDMLATQHGEWTAKMDADYEKARVKLAHLDAEKRYRLSVPERPYAHYAPATLKTQLYRVNKRLAELEPRKASLTIQERGEWNALHDKLRGLLAEQKARGVEPPPAKRPGMKVTPRPSPPALPPPVKPPANERMARIQQAYAQRGSLGMRLTAQTGDVTASLASAEQELTALGADVRAEIDARLEAKLGGSARFANYDERRDALVEVLSEVRTLGRAGVEMGSTKSDVFVNAGSTRNRAWKSVNKMADQYLPTDWLKNMTRSLDVGVAKRGFFREYGGKGASHMIRVSERKGRTVEAANDRNATVAIHELGHLMERLVPGVRPAEAAFYERRTLDRVTGEQEPSRRYRWGKKDERVRPDQFLDEYMGKDYAEMRGGDPTRSSYEILSMGLESLFTGSYNLWASDPDMANFLLGLLAGV